MCVWRCFCIPKDVNLRVSAAKLPSCGSFDRCFVALTSAKVISNFFKGDFIINERTKFEVQYYSD